MKFFGVSNKFEKLLEKGDMPVILKVQPITLAIFIEGTENVV
jgi:hypothetical protein